MLRFAVQLVQLNIYTNTCTKGYDKPVSRKSALCVMAPCVIPLRKQRRRGLFEDNQESDDCLTTTAISEVQAQLRQLYVTICSTSLLTVACWGWGAQAGFHPEGAFVHWSVTRFSEAPSPWTPLPTTNNPLLLYPKSACQ